MATIVPSSAETAVQPAAPGLLKARQAAGLRVEAYLRAMGAVDRAIAAEQAARIVEHIEAKYPSASPRDLGRYALREAMRLRTEIVSTLAAEGKSLSVPQPPVPERAPLQMPEQRIGRVPWLLRASFWRRLFHPVRSFLRPQLPPAGI